MISIKILCKLDKVVKVSQKSFTSKCTHTTQNVSHGRRNERSVRLMLFSVRLQYGGRHETSERAHRYLPLPWATDQWTYPIGTCR